MIKDNFRSKIKDYSREPCGPSRNQSLPKYKMHEARIPGVRGTWNPPSTYTYTYMCTYRNDSPSTHLPHLKADGTRSPHTHVRVRLVHIVLCDLATIKSRNREIDNKQSENFMKGTSCNNNYMSSVMTRYHLRQIPCASTVSFRNVFKQISTATWLHCRHTVSSYRTNHECLKI